MKFVIFGFMLVFMAGCAGNQQGFQKAFDSQHSLTQNQCSFSQPSDTLFKLVKQTFIQQGFTVENADLKSGVVKAIRNMADRDNPEISYNISVSTDISDIANSDTTVSMAASQQTILHRSNTTWWHLLWILPIIPTGTEYQTLVIKEGNITDPGFYTDFFNSLKIAVTKYDFAVKAAAAKAAEKAEAERVAAEKTARIKVEAEAERVATEKAAIIKAETEAKALAEKAEKEQVIAENISKNEVEFEAKAAAVETQDGNLTIEKADSEKLATTGEVIIQ